MYTILGRVGAHKKKQIKRVGKSRWPSRCSSSLEGQISGDETENKNGNQKEKTEILIDRMEQDRNPILRRVQLGSVMYLI